MLLITRQQQSPHTANTPSTMPAQKRQRSKNSSNVLTATNITILSVLMRAGFFLFGQYQDTHMEVKYTDIDYVVFSDAANYINLGASPYERETYRYTPLLAWALTPNSLWPDFGKLLFVLCDLVTGLIILKILALTKTTETKKAILSAIWLLNPMLVTISTRGSSESVLTVFVMLFIYYLLKRDVTLSGALCGLAIHFKIYPVIYLPTTVLFLTNYTQTSQIIKNPFKLINESTVKFLLSAAFSFAGLGLVMYNAYGYEFLEHAYLYHWIRTDHRHNFSVYNISLYFSSALPSTSPLADLSKWAFFPQLLISTVLIPLVLTKKSLTDTLFLQTFAFVTFNKVMTSQYFIWFLIFLPLYLRSSKLVSAQKTKGAFTLALWICSQALWLLFAYNLEFLGKSTFFPGLLSAAVIFFLSNIFILGVFMDDIATKPQDATSYI